MGLAQSYPVSKDYGQRYTPERMVQKWATLNKFEREDACRSLRRDECISPCVLTNIQVAQCRSQPVLYTTVTPTPTAHLVVGEQASMNCSTLATPESIILHTQNECTGDGLAFWPYILVAAICLVIGICVGAIYTKKKIRTRQ